MTREVHVVVPAGIDDPASPSGGNPYDRRVVPGPGGDRLGRCTSARCPAAGRARTPRPAPGWRPPSPRCRTARSCSSTGWWPAGSPTSSSRRRAGSRSSCSCTCRSATRRGRRRSWRRASGRSWPRPPRSSPPARGRRAGSSPSTGWTPPGSRSRRPGVDPAPLAPGTGRRRRPAVRRRAHPDEGPGPAGRGARRGPRPAVDLPRWSARCATPGTSPPSAPRSSGTGWPVASG